MLECKCGTDFKFAEMSEDTDRLTPPSAEAMAVSARSI